MIIVRCVWTVYAYIVHWNCVSSISTSGISLNWNFSICAEKKMIKIEKILHNVPKNDVFTTQSIANCVWIQFKSIWSQTLTFCKILLRTDNFCIKEGSDWGNWIYSKVQMMPQNNVWMECTWCLITKNRKMMLHRLLYFVLVELFVSSRNFWWEK